MRACEFTIESQQTTINKLYDGNFPDRDESFWDEVRSDEFDEPLEVKTMPKYKLAIMLQGQYRVEHLDELVDMMDEEQQEILQRYMADPGLSQKIILISGNRIIDGNHRALAAAMKGVPINYVDLADLDEQDVAENNENTGGDYAIHLGNLKRFFKAEDPLEELVPERRTHYYALHSDMFKDDGSALPWRKTFASLTGKDFKEVLHNPRILSGYRPKKYPIPPGTLVGDMHLANLYYSKVFAKTPEEKQEIARQYKESLVPLEVADLSKYKKPELLIPKGQGVAEDTVDEAKRRKRKKYHTPRSITTGWWSGYYGDDSSGGEGGGGE